MRRVLLAICITHLLLFFGCQGETKNAATAAPEGQAMAGGQILHIDPETGELGTPTAEDLAELEAYSPPDPSGDGKARVQQGGGLVVEEFSDPTYSLSVTNPEGLHRKPMVVTIDPKGEPVVTHVPPGHPPTETTSEPR